MANEPKSKPKPKPEKKDPVYTVVALDRDGRMEIASARVPAKNQEAACDEVVNALAPDDRHGSFGAFLAGSFKAFDYGTKQEVVTTKQERDPFHRPQPEEAEPGS